MVRKIFAAVMLAVFALVGAPAHAQQTLTAADFAHGPRMWSPVLSPDGHYVAAIQETDQGQALVVIDWRTRHAQVIQLARRDRSLFLETVAWKNNDRLIFVMRQRATMYYVATGSHDLGRDPEEFDVLRIFAVNRDGGQLAQIFENQQNRMASRDASIQLIDTLRNDPTHVLVGTWGQRGFTLYRADIGTGQVQSVEDADWTTFSLITDVTGRPVMRVDALPYHSGYRIFRRGPDERRWTLAHEVRGSQQTQNRDFAPITAGPAAGQVYVAARAEGQDYQAIYLYNTATGELGQPVFSAPHADSAVAWINPNTNAMIVGCGEAQRWQCRALDPAMQRHFDGLTRYFEDKADFGLVSASADGQLWLLAAEGPTIPTTYYMYDVAAASVTPIASTQPQIPRAQLAATRVFEYSAHDGTHLWGYLTTPAGAGPFRTVVMPHGGPMARDSFGYDFTVQFLVSRGYAVFQPNFRGSEGSGRSFAEAGFHQWGRLMQDDITDGVHALIDGHIADANKICIAGISYGGYAALAGAALTPDLYKCAISIAGLSDLPDLIDSERSDSGRRSALYASVVQQIGDPDADRDALIAASPRRRIDQIHIPILLIHGELDDVAPVTQSQRMRDALQHAGKTVRYVEVPAVYHPWDGWDTTQARMVLQEMDQFLGQNLPQ